MSEYSCKSSANKAQELPEKHFPNIVSPDHRGWSSLYSLSAKDGLYEDLAVYEWCLRRGWRGRAATVFLCQHPRTPEIRDAFRAIRHEVLHIFPPYEELT